MTAAVAGGLRDDGSPTSDTREAYLADLNVTRAAALKATHPTPWYILLRALSQCSGLARRQDKDERLVRIRRWVYFNAVEFEWCDDPTESQIAWQIYAALAYGAKVS